MDETIDAYVARLLGYVGEADPMSILAATPQRLRYLTEGRSREELARTGDPSKWSVVQILAHLADSEVVGAWRFRSVIAHDGVPLQSYDQNAWAAAFRYAEADPQESLALFGAARTATLSLLRRMDPALRANHGVHAERGRESVVRLMQMYAGHDLNHVAQIEKLLGA